jgi:hypothetical protein
LENCRQRERSYIKNRINKSLTLCSSNLEATVPITNAAPPNTTAVAIANAFPTIKLKTK